MEKSKKRLLILISFIFILIISFTACGTKVDTKTTSAKILVYAVDKDPAGWDPQKVPAASSIKIYSQIYSGLTKMDANGSILPDLALSWSMPNATTYIFNLRHGVKFQNGREMIADDVKYSLERIKDPKTAAIGKSYLSLVKSIDVIDKYTVKVTLSGKNAPFLTNLASVYCSIVPKEVVEKNGDLMKVTCGTGPYMLKEYVPNNYIKLVKNPNYYIKGQPKVDGITYMIMSNEASRVAAIRTGKINITPISAQSLPLLKNNKNVKIMGYDSLDYSYLGFNMTKKPFNNIKVRQAISLAVNRTDIINVVYNGGGKLSGPVPSTLKNWAINVETQPMYKYDVNKAKALLAEAGYPNGFKTSITVDGGYPDMVLMAQKLQGYLKLVGIDAEIKQLETSQYIDAWSNKKHDMIVGSNGAGSDPDRSLNFFFGTKGTANVWGYSNPQFDNLVNLGKTLVADTKQRKEVYTKAQEMVINDCPNLFINSMKYYYAVSTNVQAFNPTALGRENLLDVDVK